MRELFVQYDQAVAVSVERQLPGAATQGQNIYYRTHVKKLVGQLCVGILTLLLAHRYLPVDRRGPRMPHWFFLNS